MKKMITAILTAALVLSIGAISTFAAAPGQNANYTDADNDGVCDNYVPVKSAKGTGAGQNANYTDANNDGVCDNYAAVKSIKGTGAGQNANYTDTDNDGVCDNYAAKVCPQNGAGYGHGFSQGRQNGKNVNGQ
ncbi:MAG TPA: hypothetical protein IAD34_02895 [Candidatus Scatovicinus merdipullorum]|nr:hypothetical protein [Candidatus Scatovicinus merdipullorum]